MNRNRLPLGLWPRWAAGVLLAGGLACSSPVAPQSTDSTTTPIPTGSATERLIGLWAGSAQAMTCAGPACSSWVTYPGDPRAFTITVIESGAGYAALLDIDVRVHLTGELSGVAQPDGTVTFTGSFRPPESSSTGAADIHAFTIRLDPTAGLTGDFSYTVHWKTGDTFVTGRVLSAERTLPSPTANCGGWSAGGRRCFDGDWEGDFVIRTVEHCEGVGCSWDPGDDTNIRLSLAEGADGLRGTVQLGTVVPVTGWAQSTTARLSGARPPVSCEYPGYDVDVECAATIDAMELSLDRLGRLQGTARFSREHWSGGSGGSHYQAMRLVGELRNVVRSR